MSLEGQQPEPAVKPAWVGKPPQKVNGEDIFTVTTGPHANHDLCQKDMAIELRKKVDAYIDRLDWTRGRREASESGQVDTSTVS